MREIERWREIEGGEREGGREGGRGGRERERVAGMKHR